MKTDMLSNNAHQKSASRWSWRPGMRPRNALLLGGAVAFVALVLASLGLITLVLGLLDSVSPPLQLVGVVTAHTLNGSQHIPHLTIQLLHAPDFPATLSPIVSTTAFQHLSNQQTLLVNFSPRLHFAYALNSIAHPSAYYALPGTSAAGNPLGSCALLLLGLVLLPYPALLAHWGWRDLLAELSGEDRPTLLANVVARRTTAVDALAKRPPQPGVMRVGSRGWYGLILLPVESDASQRTLTMSVSQEQYDTVREGARVQVSYSPHLHYLYKIEHVRDE